MPTEGKPNVTRADADSVVRQLQGLRKQLNPGEQQVLDTVLQSFAARVNEPKTQELLKDFPEAPELLEDVSAFALRAAPTQPDAITPTWTTVTIGTVAASHPWITCNIAAAPR